MKHRGDHAVVLFPGAAAAEEGDEEDHDPNPDDDDGDAGGRRVLDLVGAVQTNLHQDADDDQGEAAYLQGDTQGDAHGSEGRVRLSLSAAEVGGGDAAAAAAT